MTNPADDASARESEPDNGQRRFLRGVVRDAADHFGVRLDADLEVSRGSGAVFSWRDRTLGCRVLENTDSGTVVRWLRVTYEHTEWAHGKYWTGNVDANTLTGIPKPAVLRWHEWAEGTGLNRAELMTYVDEPPCSPTADAHADAVVPPDPWWRNLRTSLNRLAAHQTDRVTRDHDYTEQTLHVFFGDWAPLPTRWATSHGDLHWANLTTTTPVLLDWEHWGQAPAGFDAAHLYCHSLASPALAAEVRRHFGDILDTSDGQASQLLVIAGMLRRIDNGDYPHLLRPLHHLADRLLGRTPNQPT